MYLTVHKHESFWPFPLEIGPSEHPLQCTAHYILNYSIYAVMYNVLYILLYTKLYTVHFSVHYTVQRPAQGWTNWIIV